MHIAHRTRSGTTTRYSMSRTLKIKKPNGGTWNQEKENKRTPDSSESEVASEAGTVLEEKDEKKEINEQENG